MRKGLSPLAPMSPLEYTPYPALAVLAWPQTTRWTRPATGNLPPPSASDSERLMREAIDAQQKDAPPAPPE